MPIPKLEITNPQAIELINKIKSGEIYRPILERFKKYRWYFLGFGIALVLIIALIIGKTLSESAEKTIYTPSDIESVTPTTEDVVESDFSGIKKEIQDFNTDLPDPFIPSFDNNISLEEAGD